MKELIKITEQNGTKAVSARELYEVLGYDKSQWARWYEKNIINNEFAFENIDYQVFDIVSNTGGRPTKDFVLTIDFAKKLAMKANSAKGEEVREYFIQMEKIAKNPAANLTKIDLAQMVIESEREKEQLQIQNQQQAQRLELQSAELQKQAPKVAYYEAVLQSQSTYNVNKIAKELGMSAITLNKKLHQMGVQYKQNGTWLLYHKYQDKGYTKTETDVFTDANGKEHTRMLTVWTEKGRQFIHDLLAKALKIA